MNDKWPHSENAERAVIGGILLNPNKINTVQLSHRDFFIPKHAHVWQRILLAHSHGKLPDISAVADKQVGYGELSDYTQYAVINEFFTQNVQIVKHLAARRALIGTCEKMARLARADQKNTPELFAETLSAISKCWQGSSDPQQIGKIAEKVIEECRIKHKNPNSVMSSVPTGIESLDKRGLSFDGIPVGHSTIIAGDTGQGKSALAQTIAVNAAGKGYGVLYVSLEDNAKALATRRMSQFSGIENRQLQRRAVSSTQWELVKGAARKLKNLNVIVLDEYFESVDIMLAEASSICEDQEINMAIIDYLQLVPSGKYFAKQQQDTDYVYGQILGFSKRHPSIATIAVSQLRRREKGSEPEIRDLYHSGKLEQGTNTIMLIWNPAPTGWPREKGGVDGEPLIDCRVIKIAKQKDGPACNAIVGWDENTTTFYDADVYDYAAYKKTIKE